MTFTSQRFGIVEVDIHIDRFSAVDSYIEGAYSETLDRLLTDDEVELLNEDHTDIVQQYAWESGETRNHN